MIERLAGGRRHYAWLIVAVTFVTLITTAGFRATPGVLIVPLQQEFGWSRGTISIAVSLGLVLFGLTAPFSAALMERFGIRRVMLIALVTVATGASLTTIMDAPWQLDLLWGVVVGGATGAVSVPLAATIANRWFESRRGFVTGILTASNASGQMIFLPLLAWLATAYGWRYAALAVAVRRDGRGLPDRRALRSRPPADDRSAAVRRDRAHSGAGALRAAVPPRDRRSPARRPLAHVLVALVDSSSSAVSRRTA